MAFILHTLREEIFAGINVRELGLTKDYTGNNFRKRNLYKYFEGINFACTLKEYFSTNLVYGFEKNLSKYLYFLLEQMTK